MISRSSSLLWVRTLGVLLVGSCLVRADPSSVISIADTGHFQQTSATATQLQNADLELNIFGISGAVSLTTPNISLTNIADNYSGPSKANLTAVTTYYGGGSYSVTVGSNTITNYGGAWVGTNYVMSANSALSITSNAIGITTGQSGLISIEVDDANGNPVNRIDTFDTPSATTATLSLLGNTLTAGHTYQISIDFNALIDEDSTSIPGTLGVSSFTRSTSFNLEVTSAVPEPSTFGIAAGVAALLGVAVVRRRQAVGSV
jgi:hypothetical protein